MNSPSLMPCVKILLSFNSSLICRLQLLCIINKLWARRGWNKGKSLMTIIDFGIKFHFIALLLLHTINTDIKTSLNRNAPKNIFVPLHSLTYSFSSNTCRRRSNRFILYTVKGFILRLHAKTHHCIVVWLSKLICLSNKQKRIKKKFVK